MYFILLHHYADIVGSKFGFFYFLLFKTGLRMRFEGGQIRPDILNEISQKITCTSYYCTIMQT